MNPVLLKPGSDRTSQVVVLGRPWADVSAVSYREHKAALLEVSLDCLADLRRRYDVVVCEGAGSPAEINLRATDIANMGLARAAAAAGARRRRHQPGRRVRGDVRHAGAAVAGGPGAGLRVRRQQVPRRRRAARARPADAARAHRPADVRRPALDRGARARRRGLARPRRPRRAAAAGRPRRAAGVGGAPAAAVELDRRRRAAQRARRAGALRDARRRSSPTPTSSCCPAPARRWPTSAGCGARGLDRVLAPRAAEGRPVLGVCGGYQMLGTAVCDEVESRAGEVAGLGLLPVRPTFGPDKVLARPQGAYGPHPVTTAYEIHHGRVRREGGEPLFATADGGERAAASGAVLGTVWHGALESDGAAPGAAGRGRDGRRAGLDAGGAGLRGRPAGPARRARRPRRRPPRHRRGPAPARARGAGRAAVRASRRARLSGTVRAPLGPRRSPCTTTRPSRPSSPPGRPGRRCPRRCATGSPARRLRDAASRVATFPIWSRRVNEAQAELGLDFLSGYVWGRAAALGVPTAGAAAAAFAWFEPSLVGAVLARRHRAQRAARSCSPCATGRRRRPGRGARRRGRRRDRRPAAGRGARAADRGPPAARRACASGRCRPDAAGRLQRACELLREARGDAHTAVVVASGLGAVEAERAHRAVARDAARLLHRDPRVVARRPRAAVQRLEERGDLADGGLTAARARHPGRASRRRPTRPWPPPCDALGDSSTTSSGRLHAWGDRCVAAGDVPADVAQARGGLRPGPAGVRPRPARP